MMAAAWHEQAITFSCEGERLLGIVHLPADSAPAAAAATGVLIVVGGPQYRAGSHRQFVQLARAAANSGHPTLRFDARGMGDSSGTFPGFENTLPDIGAAIDELQRRVASVRRVVLLGLCDGASSALLYAGERQDPRIAGLVLLNPWVRSNETMAQTHVRHYYLQRATERDFWLKLLKGGVGVRAMAELASNLKTTIKARLNRRAPAASGGASFQDRMAVAMRKWPGPMMFGLSEQDYTAREFEDFAKQRKLSSATACQGSRYWWVSEGADHTFSNAQHQATLTDAIFQWLSQQGRPTSESGLA